MKFDGIYKPEMLQKDIFGTLQSSIKGFLNGESHSFFAYGQTGAGKTYTMMGDFEEQSSDYTKYLTSESRGVLPRAFGEILEYIENRKCRLWAAFYEIYNDKIYDLLNTRSRLKKGGLDFRETADGYNTIVDLEQLEINSVQAVLNCLRVGIQNRATGSTNANAKSSRSHSIFQLKLVQADPKNSKKTIISQLKIIDLAGSEKFAISKDLTAEEKELRIAELTSINSSLSTLGLCVSALTEPKRTHIPFRNSKLTRVLSDTLSGSSKITFIVCISPSIESNNETLSTLQFASRAKKMVLEGRVPAKPLHVKSSSEFRNNFDNLVNSFRQLCVENGLLQEQCDLDTQKKIVSIETEIHQLRQENAELKNELNRLGRSCSPTKRGYTEASPVRRSVPKPAGRSVSPFTPRSRIAKTCHTEEKSYSPVKKQVERKTTTPAPFIEIIKIKEKKTPVKESFSPRPIKTSPIQSEMIAQESNITQSSPQEKQSRTFKDSLKFKAETTSDSLSQRKEEETFQKPLLSSFDSKKSNKEKSVILENSKESIKNTGRIIEVASTSSRSEASTPTLSNNAKSLKRIPSPYEAQKSTNHSSQKNLQSEKEIQSMVQLLKESVVNAIEHKVQSNINTAKGHSDSLQLYEWSGCNDEPLGHLGILNNHDDISEILPNMLRSNDNTEADIILGSNSESMRKSENNQNNQNNHSIYKDVLSRKLSENLVIEKQKSIAINPFENADKEMTQDSEYNGEEMIKEFNRKLHSVQQLNQQHQCLIQNLNSKFGDFQQPTQNRGGNSANEIKVLTMPDKKQERKEVRRAISDLKQEVTTALQEIQTFQSEDGTLIYEPRPNSSSGSQESKQSGKVQNIVVKPEPKESPQKPKRLVYKGPSTTSLVSTSDNEGTPTKSASTFESKSIMDIITKHWEMYKGHK